MSSQRASDLEPHDAPLAAPLTLAGGALAAAAFVVAVTAPQLGGRYFFAAMIVAGALAVAGLWGALPIRRGPRATRALVEVCAGGLLLVGAVLLVVFHVDRAWTDYAVYGGLAVATALIGSGASHLRTASGA